jgi:hypothetical protein
MGCLHLVDWCSGHYRCLPHLVNTLYRNDVISVSTLATTTHPKKEIA